MSNYIIVKTDKIDIKQINKKLAINLIALSNSDNIHEALDEWVKMNLGRIEGENNIDFKKRVDEAQARFINRDNMKYRCICGGCVKDMSVFFNKHKDNDNLICVADGNSKTSCIRYFNNYKRIKVSDATPEEIKRYNTELQKLNHNDLMIHWGFNKKMSYVHTKIKNKEKIYFNIPYEDNYKVKKDYPMRWDKHHKTKENPRGTWYFYYSNLSSVKEFMKLGYDLCE